MSSTSQVQRLRFWILGPTLSDVQECGLSHVGRCGSDVVALDRRSHATRYERGSQLTPDAHAVQVAEHALITLGGKAFSNVRNRATGPFPGQLECPLNRTDPRVAQCPPPDSQSIARDAAVSFRWLTTKVYAVQACSRLQNDVRRCSMATPFRHPLLKTIRAGSRWPLFCLPNATRCA